VHVTVTTTKGSPDQPVEVARIAGEEMAPWLREIDGFEGMLVLSDETAGRTVVVTFWESRELADAHLAARAEFRDRVTSTVEVRVEDVSDYELMFAEWPRGARDGGA
jgi:heme-degrading monooxygenase HmoA